MKIKLFFLCWLAAGALSARPNRPALIPMPNRIEQKNGEEVFRLSSRTVLYVNSPGLAFAARTLQNTLAERTGFRPETVASAQAPVRLLLDASLPGKERYILEVGKNGIMITGATPGAVYYGVVTLEQLLLGDECCARAGEIAGIRIDDAPRLAYRALMLDPARHFFPVEDVKFFIDRMSKYKYNVLQLHLTDDQGWRIEIKKYPRLTQVGAFRDADSGPDGPENGFYTQEQLKELVRFAAERNVEIVPELDIPGHTVALLAAYPELGCTHTGTQPKTIGKTVDMVVCAANEKVYGLYRDVLAEVAAVFPSKRIHLGGDEAIIDKNWPRCARCSALMKEKGYTKASEVMGYFFGKMLTFVEENGKEPMLWCELDAIRPPATGYLFDYPENVTLVSWRGGLTPACIGLTAQSGNPLILAPGEYAYLDYPQWKNDLPEYNNWGMPVTSLEQTYRFDPGYGLPAAEQAHIIGVMGTLWSEAMKDMNRVMYMTYPRALALAEAGWTQMEFRGWESFKERMYPNLLDMMKHGVSVRAPFEVVERLPLSD
ncbi:MAG: beta-N-acetylhexosaminidase [Parabacteroides sp.]|nr:beta-N-acetylhexosaminidase [Parabacteroides sp.]